MPKKNQGGEEGRRIFSESCEENPKEEEPIPNRQFCINSTSPLAPDPASLFSAEEIQALLRFLHAGGRLLAFAYRFGDSFTGANLGDLFGPLGCLLHDDAIIDITALRATPSLLTHFDTPAELLSVPWFRQGVDQVRCRADGASHSTAPTGASALPRGLLRWRARWPKDGSRCLAAPTFLRLAPTDCLTKPATAGSWTNCWLGGQGQTIPWFVFRA